MFRSNRSVLRRLSFGSALVLFSALSAAPALTAQSAPSSTPLGSQPPPAAPTPAPHSKPPAGGGDRAGQAAKAARYLLDQLDQADAIVIGKATALRQDTVEENPVSVVTLAVSQTVRGTVKPEIEIVVPRTIIQSAGILLETGSQDQPLLGVGEEVLLFVSRYPERDNSYSITLSNVGKYGVTTTAEGERRAERYLMASPVAGGVPLSTLIQQIRLELKIPDEKPAVAPKPQ